MKTFKYLMIAATTTTILGFSSCQDDLNVIPDGRISLDEVFQDPEKVPEYLNSCYLYIPAKGCRYFFFSRGPVVWSDEAYDADAEAEPTLSSGQYYRGTASAASHPLTNFSTEAGNGDYWNRYWQAIRKCNVFLARIDKAAVSDESTRSRWTAEARLLRAYYYSELLRWFGCGLPIEREPFTYDQDFSTLKRASYYEVVQFIIEDCDAALACPDLPARIFSGGEAGRFTTAVAAALKSRMSLYAASPLYNDGQNYWEEAYQANSEALTYLKNAGYQLYSTAIDRAWNDPRAFLRENQANASAPNDPHAAAYNEYFCKDMQYNTAADDKETIFTQARSDFGETQLWHVDALACMWGDYKTGTCPTQELIDCYETTDGEPILNLQNPYQDDQHLRPNLNPANTLYDETNPYAHRDPRFYATFYFNGSYKYGYWPFKESPQDKENTGGIGARTRVIATWSDDLADEAVAEEPHTGTSAIKRGRTRTSYYERKFLHPLSGENAGNDIVNVGGPRHKEFRLGEVILNYAEAAAEAGHLTEARNAVNEIRARAGMPDLSATLTQQQLILRIRNERRVELALEGHRYFDVRRWAQLDGDLGKTDHYTTGMYIKRNIDGTYTYQRSRLGMRERMCWSSKYLRLPIPINEANILSAATGTDWQNPGWK